MIRVRLSFFFFFSFAQLNPGNGSNSKTEGAEVRRQKDKTQPSSLFLSHFELLR